MNYIKNENITTKINFIQNVISQTDIPVDFIPTKLGISENIFHRSIDGEQHPREWILFEKNTFYCAYCLCFSELRIDLLVTGVKYVKNCRIAHKLTRHEVSAHHGLTKTTYLNLISNVGMHEEIYHSEKRNAIRIIVKIIIYLATHGENSIIAKTA